ncbi:hypothetical protein SEA_GIANTSBANE_40 [Arthrobacter phage Giantsbane]|nr:hypothetical protein PBI_SHEPARD_41 [Arthrobacter phage Shepard]QGZ17244.1 hypothetical protein SEA_GIANTSBANE_40 [Arthrobacter phage Giantsbane]
MFKNRSVQLKFVKDADNTSAPEDIRNPFLNDESAALAKDIVKHVSVAVIAVSGAIITFKTLGEMAVVQTKAAANHKYR